MGAVRQAPRVRPRPLRAGLCPEHDRTPLCGGGSLGIHESQSRLWENLVGRSRPFWRHFFAAPAGRVPRGLAAVAPRASTARSTRSSRRSSASRRTRSRTTCTSSCASSSSRSCSGRLARRRPARRRGTHACDEYLGIEVPDDAHGVLQDVHWTVGVLRLLPDLRARQRHRRCRSGRALRRDLTDMDDRWRPGLRAAAGMAPRAASPARPQVQPQETLERCAGSRIDPEPYLGYLRTKVADVYGVAA